MNDPWTLSERRRGFTLAEITVVITVMAILASILFPVFAKAREAARKTACGSNLYQIGAALQMYARDYDGRFPPTDLRPLAAGYLRDPNALRCPDDWLPVSAADGTTYGSYQYRGGLSNDDRADLPVAADWTFLHNDGATVLRLSGSVKWIARKDWVPFARGPRPVPIGVRPPAEPLPTPLLNDPPGLAEPAPGEGKR